MRFIDLVRTANRNLTRSKLRTLLTILAIFVGGFTLTLTTALNTGANQYLERQLGNVSVPGVFEVLPKTDLNPLGSGEVQKYDPEKKTSSLQNAFTSTMDQADVDKLSRVEGVDTVSPYYLLQPEYVTREGSDKYQISTLSQDYGLNLDLASGRLLKDEDQGKAVLAEDYLEPLGFTAEGALNKEVTIAYKDLRGQLVEQKVTVVGVMRKTFVAPNQVFIDKSTAKTIAVAQGQGARYVVIFVTFAGATDSTDERVLKKRLEEAGNYTAVSLKERIGSLVSIVSAITAALSMVGIIALLAASFGIINTLLMSVYERTKEIGLMKALGMHRSTVFGIFAIEAALVGFWGSAIAVAAASIVSLAVNSYASQTFLKDFEGFTLLVVNPFNAAFVVGLIMAIAFLAGTLPALKASRLNPIDALRSE